MNNSLVFNFKSDVSSAKIPTHLNNPFGRQIPEIARIAAQEFQDFIAIVSQDWPYDFSKQKGKMFGILVIQQENGALGYLGTVSGKTPGASVCPNFIPSIFDDSVDDFFINKGMTAITEMSLEIKVAKTEADRNRLKEKRKDKSLALQQQLFENYRFLNLLGEEKNVLDIFQSSTQRKPPSAAGDCAAPKLLHFAFKHHLKPLAIAEFWWGNPLINSPKEHKAFYPACKDKCQPILEYMLHNTELFNQASAVAKQNLQI